MQEILAGYGAAIIYSMIARHTFDLAASDPKNWGPAVCMIGLGIFFALRNQA